MTDDIITKPFRLTLKDHIVFTTVTYYRNLFLTPWALVYAGLIFGLPALIFMDDLRDGYVLSALPTVGWMAACWLILVPVLQMYRVRQTYLTSPLVNSEHTMRLSESGLRVVGAAFDSETRWANFRRLRENRTKIFIYLSAFTAHIVPKSAFLTDTDAQSFSARAKAAIAGSRHAIAEVFTAPLETPASEWQSLPHRYTFGLHVKTYARLTRAALLRPLVLLICPGALVAISLWRYREAIAGGNWNDAIPELIGAAAFFLIFFIVFPYVMAPLTWLSARRLAGTKGPRTVSLLPDRIVAHGDSYHAELQWSALKGVRKGWGYILVFTRPNCAIAIPTSAFADKAAAQAFYKQALAYFNATRLPATNRPLTDKL